MSITAEADHATTAKIAADRARALRDQAAALSSDALAPLRAALHARAGELELAAAVLLGDDAEDAAAPRVLAIA